MIRNLVSSFQKETEDQDSDFSWVKRESKEDFQTDESMIITVGVDLQDEEDEWEDDGDVKSLKDAAVGVANHDLCAVSAAAMKENSPDMEAGQKSSKTVCKQGSEEKASYVADSSKDTISKGKRLDGNLEPQERSIGEEKTRDTHQYECCKKFDPRCEDLGEQETDKNTNRNCSQQTVEESVKSTNLKTNVEKHPTNSFNQHKLKLHQRTNGIREKSYQCRYCEKKFTRNRYLAPHERTHTGERPYQCKYCDKAFTQSNNLKDHERTHTGERPYQCKYCDKTYITGSHLKGHERTHTGQRPYQCKYCDNAYITSSHLKGHERTHTGQRPYQCKYCDKAFKKNGNLKYHVRTHTGERPYRCEYCDKAFTGTSTLKNHERTHTGEKPYQCKYCDKAFINMNSLVYHERTHKGERHT